MGREIRRVPEGWEHPKKEYPSVGGGYKDGHVPMHDESFEFAAQEWLDSLDLWLAGTHESQDTTDEEIGTLNAKYGDMWTRKMFEPTITAYAKYVGTFPDVDYYRPNWTDEERTHYQMYETVSEGTPVSPVFDSKAALADWLVTSEGYTQATADKFLESEWAPSFVTVTNDSGTTILETLDAL